MEAEIVKVFVAEWFASCACLLLSQSQHALSKSIQIDIDTMVTIKYRVLRPRVRFVEVISVVHERRSYGVDYKRSVRTNKDSYGSTATTRSYWASLIHRNVRANDNS